MDELKKQIKDLKIELKIEKKLKQRFNKKLQLIEGVLNSYSCNLIEYATKIRYIINS